MILLGFVWVNNDSFSLFSMLIFIYSESDTCGDMYGSCSDDILLKPKNSIFDSPWIKAVIVIKLCVAIGLCYYYLQVYRRRRAIQTVIDQNTQQVMVHVVRGSSTNNASLNEQGQPPPTYQQATELKAVQN